MIGSIDLMPASCRTAFERRAVIQRWVGLFLVTSVGLAALHVGGWAGQSAMRAELDALAEQARQRWRTNTRAQELLAERDEHEGTITRYNRLAWPIDVSEVVAAIGAELPDTASLSRMVLAPGDGRRGRLKRGKGDEERSLIEIELEGIAPSDVVAAGFVESLDEHPLFRAVQLEYARSADVDGTEARRFRVLAAVDLDARYRFVDAGEGGGP